MPRENSKPKANNSSGDNKKKISDSIRYFVGQLAMALGQVIPAERILLYIRALSDLTESQLAHGFEKALKFFKPEFGRVFPTPAEIREWAYEWRPPVVDPSRAILDRGDKPPGWEQLQPGELDKMRARAKQVVERVERTAQAEVNGPATTRETVPADELERRRIAQLEAFWKHNKQAGEV